MVKDMTTGAVAPILIKFSIPLLISVVFQQLYSIADSVIAGNFINKDALAAIGASYPITMIFLAIGTGMNIGCSVVISTFFGAKDMKSLKTAVFTSIISSFVIGLVLTVVGYFTSGLFLELLGTDITVFKDAQDYLNIYVFGLVFLFIYNICTGIFTSLGDSKTPLYFLIASSIGNVALDIVFVVVIPMGVPGTAWATFICQAICSILAFVVLMRRVKKMEGSGYSLFQFSMLGRISKLSVPSILQQSFVSVGNLFIQGLVNGFGTSVMAGYSSAIKLNTFAVTCFSTVGNSVSSFSAQNTGAMKYDRVKSGFKVGMLVAVAIAAVFTLVYVLFANNLIYIFMDSADADNAAAAQAGISFLSIVSPFFIMVGMKLNSDGVLRGCGKIGAFMVTTFSDLILRVVFAYILTPIFDENGIWLSWPIGWTLSSITSLILYIVYARKLPKDEKNPEKLLTE